MAEHQLELFKRAPDEIDEHFFAVEVDGSGESEYYPLGPVIDAIGSLYGYITCYLFVFIASAWLGMILGDSAYLSLTLALGDLFLIGFLMLIVPVCWPFLIVAAVCFFVPLLRGTLGAMVLSLVALSVSNVAAFGFLGDAFRTL